MRATVESLLIHVLGLSLFVAFAGRLERTPFVQSTRISAISGVTLQARGTSHERSSRLPPKPLTQTAPRPEALARAVPALAAPDSKVGSTETPGGSPSDSYLGRVREQIDRSIIYPMGFRARRIGGWVTVHLKLDPRGEIRATEIAQSSGTPELDRFVLEAVHAAGPFPPYSGQARAEILSFNLPIQLKIR